MTCETCKNSKFNNGGLWCKYSPRYAKVNKEVCRNDDHYQSIYTIEPTIVLGIRYYSPPSEEMVVVSPSELTMEGVE
jgi:hypothetical protein